MTKRSKKKLDKVTLVKLASRSFIGKLPTAKVVPNKKKNDPKYPINEENI